MLQAHHDEWQKQSSDIVYVIDIQTYQTHARHDGVLTFFGADR
jgi:hypothetical protein